VSSAVELLVRFGDEAAVMAGGTDLIVDMRYRLKSPKHIIDVKGIGELSILSYEHGVGLTIGAAVPLNELLQFEAVENRYTALHDALNSMCDNVVRNRATLVGNLCTASPAADCAPPLLVFEAEVEVAGSDGTRRIDLPELFAGVKLTSLNKNEMVTAVHLPDPPDDTVSTYVKGKRSSEDCSIVGVAAMITNRQKPSKRVARLAYSSVAPTPLIVREVEAVFREDKPWSELVDEAVKTALERVSPISDVRGSRKYRIHLVDVLTRLAFRELLGGEA
jgi:carbon-monoxide dehydrogenase medium subunit